MAEFFRVLKGVQEQDCILDAVMFCRRMQLFGEMKKILRLAQPGVRRAYVHFYGKLDKGRHFRQGGKLASFRALLHCGKERFELNFECGKVQGALCYVDG